MSNKYFDGFGVNGTQKEYDDRWAVINKKGSSKDPRCGCGGWLIHWQRYAKSSAAKCVYMGCTSPAKHGAHIQFVRVKRTAKGITRTPKSQDTYIVPLCAKHNNPNYDGPFFIRSNCECISDTGGELCKPVEYEDNNNNYFAVEVVRGKPVSCGCPSYLDHYRAITNSKRVKCSSMKCSSPVTCAVLTVSTDMRRDRDKWLAPVCRAHSKIGTKFKVKRRADLANPSKNRKLCGP